MAFCLLHVNRESLWTSCVVTVRCHDGSTNCRRAISLYRRAFRPE